MVVVPSHGFRHTLSELLPRLPKGGEPPFLISATKGIETETLARMSEVTAQEANAAGREVRFAVLTGPTFAVELAAGMPTAAVIAATDGEWAETLQRKLSSGKLRLYSATDVTGVEIGGASKNVIAIAAGVVAGLGLGHNTQAALLTRGLHEITRLVLVCGGRPRTMAGLAGMGDLVLTCTGGPSRNRRLGLALAAGSTPEEATEATPMVAEGVLNSLAVARLAHQKGVEMPITEQMVEVLHHGKSPLQAVEQLMNRQLRSEAEL
jgi:glycerol-3-phosphate dehydrogenase (NAD(P)+)